MIIFFFFFFLLPVIYRPPVHPPSCFDGVLRTRRSPTVRSNASRRFLDDVRLLFGTFFRSPGRVGLVAARPRHAAGPPDRRRTRRQSSVRAGDRSGHAASEILRRGVRLAGGGPRPEPEVRRDGQQLRRLQELSEHHAQLSFHPDRRHGPRHDVDRANGEGDQRRNRQDQTAAAGRRGKSHSLSVQRPGPFPESQ